MYGYRIVGKKLVKVDSADSTKRVGYVEDTSFLIEENLLDTNTVSEDDRMYDINKKIEVGDLVQASVTRGEASRWSMTIKGGVVGALSTPDDVNDYNTSGGYVYVRGKLLMMDTVSRIILLETEGVKRPFYMNVTAVIDPATNKITNVSPGEFKEGDIVYAFSAAGRLDFMVKNP